MKAAEDFRTVADNADTGFPGNEYNPEGKVEACPPPAGQKDEGRREGKRL